jgi:cytochrome c peroxidase
MRAYPIEGFGVFRWLAIAVIGAVLAGCGGGGAAAGASEVALSPAAALGEKIFFDASLSASGQMSCATCHAEATAHATNDPAVVVPAGGEALTTPGFRNAPSLRYLNLTPAFFFDKEGTPTGGFNRDGRANSLTEQVERPFLAAHEMANDTAAAVVEKAKSAAWADEFRRVFGAAILDAPDAAFDRMRFALSRYQQENNDFHPFDSKYDLFIAGKVALTGRELQGLALFNDPARGNCAACHPSGRASDGSPPLFTDFTYDNIGVPRNPAIPANADARYFDLGLCAPFRTDLANRTDLCGAFKVPTLRNVAITAPYFHNGRFRTLREVVAFYVRRDTNPEEWYPRAADGSVNKFDDLPPAYIKNVNTTEVPYNQRLGDAPALSADEIDLVVEFLQTLTDGYRP